MTFLRDYVPSKNKWLGSSGLALILATGLIANNYSSGINFEERSSETAFNEYSGIDALFEMGELYNEGVGLDGGNLLRDSSLDNIDYIISTWENLPKEDRYEVLGSLVTLQMRESGYEVRDFTRDNIGDAMFFMLGGGM
ncbi:hypothetical protein HOB91_01865 [Candidatus Woesearchaeota archaeon]|nr:hypothetical protein [Candidatus Woesearchaeota archaeon]